MYNKRNSLWSTQRLHTFVICDCVHCISLYGLHSFTASTDVIDKIYIV
jgi:hypothetical protein